MYWLSLDNWKRFFKWYCRFIQSSRIIMGLNKNIRYIIWGYSSYHFIWWFKIIYCKWMSLMLFMKLSLLACFYFYLLWLFDSERLYYKLVITQTNVIFNISELKTELAKKNVCFKGKEKTKMDDNVMQCSNSKYFFSIAAIWSPESAGFLINNQESEYLSQWIRQESRICWYYWRITIPDFFIYLRIIPFAIVLDLPSFFWRR